ncbi:hypothetical protein COLO4_22878 [Corchorus olitorius]|uniref:Uncharacterized protein n=1 Tax=Corchorus olitorius TaxID=93759 RepID=A0A1R3IJE3_9ROSI|nr:hypothetical protein COLO4_22878 [Corchorus olitorius]
MKPSAFAVGFGLNWASIDSPQLEPRSKARSEA